MKKLIAWILALAMVMALAACGAKEEKPAQTISATTEMPAETTLAMEAEPLGTLEAKYCFYDAGFVEIVSGAVTSAECIFTAENSEEVVWSVYVLEEAFDDSFRYIKQIAEPVLVGDGSVFVEKGQYVYVYCSSNEFTTGVADENAKLNITVK